MRNRVKELRNVRAGDLIPNAKNWRKHPKEQRDALRGILNEVGFVGALLARELPDGRLELIDGHLRAETTPDDVVPVLVVDLTEPEAAKVLATHDPLAAMADTDFSLLNSLITEIEVQDESLMLMLDNMASSSPLIDLGDPPESIERNIEELAAMKSQRKNGNKNTIEKGDTEKYLVIVYPSRISKEEALKRLGLPSDERYIPAGFIELRPRGNATQIESSDGRSLKAAPSNKSGAGG